MCPGVAGEGMVMESPGAGRAGHAAAGDTSTSFSPDTRKETRSCRAQHRRGLWGGAGRWWPRGEADGRQPIACCCPWLLHVSHASPGYVLPALLLQVTRTDTHGHAALLRGNKAKPQGPCKGLCFPELPPQSCCFASLFCPGTGAAKQRGNPRAPSGSHRSPSPPNLRACVPGL